jgi:hypothetical protein
MSHCRRLETDEEMLTMAVESHLVELEQRHRALEREIEVELAQPGSDTLRLTELKRRKLQVKDELVRLQGNRSVH